jgi:tetratricopeptide (TPR) repeat protein
MRSHYPILLLLLVLAVLTCTPALGYSPEAVAWYGKGNAFVATGNLTEAIDAYDQATTLDPTYYEAWNARADALNRDGRFSDALASSSKALAINASYIPGWINRGQILYNIGYVYEDQKNDPAKATEYYQQQVLAFEQAITLDPSNADAWFNKGYALAGMKRYDEALAAFDKVKELDPSYPKIDKNRQIAQQLKDAAIPDYVRYAPIIVGIAAVLIGIALWFFVLREKEEE